MDRRQSNRGVSLVLACGLATPIWAIAEDPQPAIDGASEAVASAAQAAQPAGIRFNFKDTPFDQVLDIFSREAGLPIIREAEVPKNALTFLSAKRYSYDEALEILNLNLRMHGVQLQQRENFLYLTQLANAARSPTAVLDPSELERRSSTEFVTFSIPLNNASAALVAERIAPLIKEPGLVQAVDQQNMLIIVETVDQVRRINELVSRIDSMPPADVDFRVFPLRYGQAARIEGTLRGLVPEYERTLVKDAKNNPKIIDDVSKPPMKIQRDDRLNAVVAMGPTSRMGLVQQLVQMLDSPDGSEAGGIEPQLMTFTLESVSTQEAARVLDGLFRAIPPNRRPQVLPLPEQSKLTVVGLPTYLAQASALLGELDPRTDQVARPERVARAIELEHIDAGAVERIAQRLLTPRQRQVLSWAPTPNGDGLVVAGPDADVSAFERLVEGIDAAPDIGLEVRVLSLASPEPQATLARARELFDRTQAGDEPELEATLEERSLTLIGTRQAIDRFQNVLRDIEGSAKVEIEQRSFTLTQRTPSEIVRQLSALASSLLRPTDGSAFAAPSFEALDELDALLVRAEPEQFETIAQLVQQLDAERPGDRQLRVIDLRGSNPSETLERARGLYDRLAAGRDDLGELSAELDAASGSVIVTARRAALSLFEQALTQSQQLTPPVRTTRIVDVQNVDAAEVLAPLEELLASADPIDPSRAVPAPTIRVMPRTNSLLVTAEDAQHRVVVDYVRRLDQIEPSDLPPLRLLQLRTADANAIAGMLNQQYRSRPQADRVARPVDVRSDASTNTLIVSAHPELFDEIKTFVDDLNTEQREGPERVTVLFNLKVAKAADVASAMDKLYPEPPMPRDRRGNPMPWLQEPKEVTVSADPSSNSLIIDAPADRIASLEELAAKLDRVELPPVAELRTYRVVGADLDAISRTLNALARSGSLSAPAQPGKQAVRVTIDTEPKSSTLIVAGDQTTFERVEQMLEDLSAVQVERELRIVPIANADADAVRTRAMEIYDAQVAGLLDAGSVAVSVDDQTNSLEVVADNEAMARFMRVLDQLQEQAGPQREVRLIELRLVRASKAAEFLTDLVSSSQTFRVGGGPDPEFEVIESTNTILVAAQPVQLPIIEQLVRNLDNSEGADTPPMRILRLRSTDAANLANVLQRSYDRRTVEERTREPVTIQADSATNTLLVSAHESVLPEIEAIITELNEQQAFDAEGREIRIFPLSVARAEDLARTIDQMFPEPPMPYDPRTRRSRPDLRQPKEVVVRSDRGTNSLIVDAPASRMIQIDQLVKNLDRDEVAGGSELRTYRLARADLAAAATTITNLAASGALGAVGQKPIAVQTDPVSRTLIVTGPSEIFARIDDVLAELDQPPQLPATELRLYSLTHARADRLQPLLEQLLIARLRERPLEDGMVVVEAERLLEVAADTGSNTLIVNAPSAIQEVAQQLIDQLDVEASAAGRPAIRVVPLTFGDADRISQTITQALGDIDLPTGGDVAVLSAGTSNALVLTGAAADLDRVQELIDPLDRQPLDENATQVESLPLEHADASAISRTVLSLLEDQLSRDPRVIANRIRFARGNLPDTPPPVRVEADERTNTLIVSGPVATVELARQIVERLDIPAPEDSRRVLTFTPMKANGEQLVQTVDRVLSSRDGESRDRVELTFERQSGSVILVGQQDRLAEAVRLLGEFDERAVAIPEVELRVFALKVADAEGLARSIQPMLSDRARWPEELRRAEQAGINIAQPRVNADGASNRLLVSAPRSLMPMAAQLVEAFDEPSGDAARAVEVFGLSKGNAESVAASIREALEAARLASEPMPAVSAEPRSNSVIVTGTQEQLARARGLVDSLDSAIETDGVAVRTIFLTRARAEQLAPVIEQALARQSELDLIPDWSRWAYLSDAQRRGRENVVPTPVRVVAEGRLNALIVSGPTTLLELAEQLAQELDSGPDGPTSGERIVRVITPAAADAAELSQSIEALLVDGEDSAAPPVVRVDRQSNSLLIRGTPEQVARVESLVGELDRAAISTGQDLRLIRVDPSRADAEAVAQTVRQLLERRGGVRVEVISAEELARPKSSGDQGRLDFDPTIQWFRAGSRNGTIAESVVGLLAASLAQPEEPDAGSEAESGVDLDSAPTVTIAVDPETNSILVVGSSRVGDRVADLVREIQDQMPPEPVAVRVVTLPEGSDIWTMTNVVRQTINQVGRASEQNPGGFTGRVAVAPDPSNGALIVWANDTDFDVVGSLIGSLTRGVTADALTVKLYALENVQANQAVRTLNDFVSASPRGRQARRVRDLTLAGEDVRATLDPTKITVSQDPSGTSVIVTAPAASLAIIDRFVELIDQSPVGDRMAIRAYELDNADAQSLARTMGQLFAAQRRGSRSPQSVPQAQFVADGRTNTLLVTASSEQHAEVQRLIAEADRELADEGLSTEVFSLANADPRTAANVVREIVIGRDPAKRDRVLISSDRNSSALVVRASEEDLAEVRSLIAEIDRAEVGGLPLRILKLDQADAAGVAQSIQNVLRARGSRSGGRQQPAVVGDRRSGTLIVAASDEDFAQIEDMVSAFDAPAEGKAIQIKTIQLQNARVADIQDTLLDLVYELQYERTWGRRGGPDEGADKLFAQFNQRANAVVLFGTGELLEAGERIVAALDIGESDQTAKTIEAVTLERADLDAVARIIRQSFATPGWRPWYGPDSNAVQVEVDRQRRVLILIGQGAQVEEAKSYITQLDAAGEGPDQQIQTITLRHASAQRAASSLQRFFADKARREGLRADRVTVIGSPDGNVLIVSAEQDDLDLVQDLVAQIDQPEIGDDRAIDVFVLKNADPRETATTLRSMFPTRRSEERVIVTPQPSTGSLIVSAPERLVEEVQALLVELDRAPTADDVSFVTITLDSARASDVALSLEQTLPDNLRVRVTPVARSNALVVSGSQEAIALVTEQIEALDTAPVRSLQEFRRFEIQHQMAADIDFALRRLTSQWELGANDRRPSFDYFPDDNTVSVVANADQMTRVEQIIEELDQPSQRARQTEFVRLRFADAEQTANALGVFYGRFAPEAKTPGERGVSIVPDPTTNSLVISAEADEFAGIQALLEKLDSEQYDTSKRIAVIPLRHADAQSVARALMQGFSQEITQQADREQQGRSSRGGRDDRDRAPTILVDGDEVPSVAAEPTTNTLIVFASPRDLERIENLVEMLDVPDSVSMPDPRVLPVTAGRASEIARTIQQTFRSTGPRGVVVVGDDRTQSLIVRAEDNEFERIRSLAQSLQDRAQVADPNARIIRVRTVPAARLKQTIDQTFGPIALQAGERLVVTADRASNTLVIAATDRMFEQVEGLVEILDGAPADPPATDRQQQETRDEIPTPGVGQSVFIYELEHHTPSEMQGLLEQLGVTRATPADRPGIVAEPVTLVPLRTRNAIAVLAGRLDGGTIGGLVEALDAEPAGSGQRVEMVLLKVADAQRVAALVGEMLAPTDNVSGTGAAAAFAEQVRRLSVADDRWDVQDPEVDLSIPVRIFADSQSNGIVIASSEANVSALKRIIELMDTLPIGDAVVVRFFPLENASAARVRQVVEELFRQGEALRRLPGTQRRGLPVTATGQALAGEIAASVDERTNALVVAGREEAVALVEVLIQQLDAENAATWLEPRLIPLEHAEPVRLAERLNRVLVQGFGRTPDALGMQRQIARLRVVAEGGVPTQTDLFAPLTGLIIEPEEDLRAIIVVGSNGNVAAVESLIEMLDVEAAGEAGDVRFYPLEHAAADRVARVINDVFGQRSRQAGFREEDRVIVTADQRTNTLVVSTSARSAEVVEELLASLDTPDENQSVDLRVLATPGLDAQRLAQQIDRLVRERIEASRRAGVPASPSDAFRVEAVPGGSSLIVAASDENFALVEQLLQSLTSDEMAEASSVATDNEIIPIRNGQASEVAAAVRDLYVDRENDRRGDRSVGVVANDRLNALVVTGTRSDILAIQRLVDQLDTEQAVASQDIRRFELQTANASEVVSLLEQLLAGRPIGGGRGAAAQQATRIRFFREQLAKDIEQQTGSAPLEAQIDGLLRDQVRLTPDLRTNSVLVAAPPEIMELIAEIITDLDSTTAGNRRIEVFRLVNADAGAMSQVLRELFNLRQRGNSLVLLPAGDRPLTNPDEDDLDSLFASTVTPVSDERRELSITIDSRTNTLLVSGTPEYLDLVRRVVLELDSIQATEREQTVFHLKNAKADEVATTLQGYFREESQRLRETLRNDQVGSLSRQLEQEVTVVGDEKSNKLVISASPRYIKVIRDLVNELDAAPPQVVIQVLLAEVTIDDSEEWGLDVQVGPFGGEDYIVGSTPAGAAIATALGVPNLSVASGDFSLLVRALENRGRLEVLSRPEVTVNNNEAAVLQVGENIAIVESVDTFESGRTQANVTRQDVGIILNVTPTISADGFVRMEITPEISSVSARSTQISEDFEAPIITQRRVDTVVTVKDGQTIVIGGLIQTQDEQRNTKVPLFGDVPVVGPLFRTRQESRVKTELLVILTPRVIPGTSPADVAKLQQLSEYGIDNVTSRDRIRALLESVPNGLPEVEFDPKPVVIAPTPLPPRSPVVIDPLPSDPAPPLVPIDDPEPELIPIPPRSDSPRVDADKPKQLEPKKTPPKRSGWFSGGDGR